MIPWTSIHELVLTEDDPPQFAVRLNARRAAAEPACAV